MAPGVLVQTPRSCRRGPECATGSVLGTSLPTLQRPHCGRSRRVRGGGPGPSTRRTRSLVYGFLQPPRIRGTPAPPVLPSLCPPVPCRGVVRTPGGFASHLRFVWRRLRVSICLRSVFTVSRDPGPPGTGPVFSGFISPWFLSVCVSLNPPPVPVPEDGVRVAVVRPGCPTSNFCVSPVVPCALAPPPCLAHTPPFTFGEKTFPSLLQVKPARDPEHGH